MSVLYRALRRAAEEERQREQGPPGRLFVSPSGKRRSSSRRLLLPSVLLVGAVGTAGLLLWPELETVLAPAPVQLRTGAAPPGPALAVRVTPLAAPAAAPPGPALAVRVTPLAAPAAVSPEPETSPRQPTTPDLGLRSPPKPAPRAGAISPTVTDAAPAPTTPVAPATGASPANPADATATPAPPMEVAGPDVRQKAAGAPEPMGPPVDIGLSPIDPDNAAAGVVPVTDETDNFRDRYEAARRLLRAGRANAALLIYDGLLRRRPTDRPALLGRAVALQRLDRVSDAIRVYEDVLQNQPDDLLAQTYLLALLGRSEPERALQALGRLYAAHPGYSLLPAQIAMIHVQLNDTANAIRFMVRAVALDPNNAVYQFNLAVLNDRAGQRSAAVRHYERALELGVGDGSAILVLAQAIRERLRYLTMN